MIAAHRPPDAAACGGATPSAIARARRALAALLSRERPPMVARPSRIVGDASHAWTSVAACLVAHGGSALAAPSCDGKAPLPDACDDDGRDVARTGRTLAVHPPREKRPIRCVAGRRSYRDAARWLGACRAMVHALPPRFFVVAAPPSPAVAPAPLRRCRDGWSDSF
ncbi:transcription initiation factor TFIID subunit 1 [Dorcoceras hygrometricum]|uniref:Transcription initiation factor TFIID subunit 1 n=1 Tax=Dorcoceras hygrometricum TaxID=472368 RepID=A0A2Z7A1T3_9LAMI|nr:transcription initiation factor TFIID subunit 1 [Dorcoceras hygrometricum]